MRRRSAGLLLVCAAVLLTASAADAVDGTPPLITFEIVGKQGSNGWYVSTTTVRWNVSDPESGIKASSGCDATSLGETAGTRLTCSATNLEDVSSTASVTVKVDTKPPAVTGASAHRPPDVGTWYVQPVTFTFAGSDATSGIAGCTSVAYAGPDNGAASVTGTCTDQAGNVSAPGSASLRYDANAPALRGVAAKAGNGEVTVRWTQLPTWEWVDVVRSVAGEKATRAVYHGSAAQIVDRGLRNGTDYRYAVVAHDEAGHETAIDVQAMPLGAMRSPPPGSTVTAPPRLGWRGTHGALLYNVQLFRDGKKILSAWPRSPHLKLLRRWRFGGAARTLEPGTYRWYVWPAFRKAHGVRFGKLIGSSSFVVKS
jgi:hypothetical protein